MTGVPYSRLALVPALPGLKLRGVEMHNTADLIAPVELADDQLDMVAGGDFSQTGNVVAIGVNDVNANVVALVQALNTGAGTITSPIFNA